MSQRNIKGHIDKAHKQTGKTRTQTFTIAQKHNDEMCVMVHVSCGIVALTLFSCLFTLYGLHIQECAPYAETAPTKL